MENERESVGTWMLGRMAYPSGVTRFPPASTPNVPARVNRCPCGVWTRKKPSPLMARENRPSLSSRGPGLKLTRTAPTAAPPPAIFTESTREDLKAGVVALATLWAVVSSRRVPTRIPETETLNPSISHSSPCLSTYYIANLSTISGLSRRGNSARGFRWRPGRRPPCRRHPIGTCRRRDPIRGRGSQFDPRIPRWP